jgi:hypothetical protein
VLACKAASFKTARLLLLNGADPNVVGYNGHMPLSAALEACTDRALPDMLIEVKLLTKITTIMVVVVVVDDDDDDDDDEYEDDYDDDNSNSINSHIDDDNNNNNSHIHDDDDINIQVPKLKVHP